ncbi:wax ester/triacylglycerol synthase domain-containing protein [Streptomyces sp. NPDC060188]|uniref:wax ester/triacylglycerol synthase domain-containing protein n=1 Tax=Streptomyces sp. NPDC060188 TaxID=3347068 RepID=UPI00364E261D
MQRSALPGPGHIDQLLDHASALHSALLDRHRPMWELHFVEGLADGRFALYSKMHHAPPPPPDAAGAAVEVLAPSASAWASASRDLMT